MYMRYEPTRATPPRIYRSIGEIRKDMRDISNKIAKTDEMLNVRSLLLDMLASEYYSDPKVMIPDLYEAIAEANDALKGLHTLNNELEALREELNETKCELGV